MFLKNLLKKQKWQLFLATISLIFWVILCSNFYSNQNDIQITVSSIDSIQNVSNIFDVNYKNINMSDMTIIELIASWKDLFECLFLNKINVSNVKIHELSIKTMEFISCYVCNQN